VARLDTAGAGNTHWSIYERRDATVLIPVGCPSRYTPRVAHACVWRASHSDATSSLGGVKSSVGDAESSLGDAKSSLGDGKSSRRRAVRAGRVAGRGLEWCECCCDPQLYTASTPSVHCSSPLWTTTDGGDCGGSGAGPRGDTHRRCCCAAGATSLRESTTTTAACAQFNHPSCQHPSGRASGLFELRSFTWYGARSAGGLTRAF
jgi:hypothetical protein